MTTTGPQTRRLPTTGPAPVPAAAGSTGTRGPDSGSYARLGDVITAAEVAHMTTGKACDQLTDDQWTKVVRFVTGKRLDQLSGQLQRLILDCLLTGVPRNEKDLDALWTSALSIEPDNRANLLSELRLLDAVLAPEATDASRKFCTFRSKASVGSRRNTTAGGAHRYNTFVVPRFIVTRTDHYVLAEGGGPLERVGSGEHSVVFRARRGSDGVHVAIKVIHPQAPQLSFFKEYLTHRRFTGEESIIQAYEAGKYTAPVGDGHATFPFMVLEYGDMTLAKLIEDRQSYTEDEESLLQPFLQQEKRFFSVSLLSIVSILHGRRIIHRDIKPENLYLVVRDDAVVGMKIGDFGIASHIPEGYDKVVLGRFEGTPAFSPRTAIEKGEYDFYTDLFGYARTVACLEPGLFMTGIGQTTQRQVRQAIGKTTRLQGPHGTTTRSAILVKAKRHMEKNLSSALFRLVESGDPFVLFVILPILDPEHYPYCPRVCGDLLPLAAAAYTVQNVLDLLAAGKHAEALAELTELVSKHSSAPWYPVMASDVAGLVRRCERDITPSV